MFYYQGQNCPVCGKPFEENEDIVSCPVCGAPHHRACWKQEGHCHFEDTHGTENQWKKEEVKEETNKENTIQFCKICGAPNPPSNSLCSQCGNPIHLDENNTSQTNTPPNFQEFSPFRVIRIDNFGGVPRNERICDQEVEDVAAIVGQNSTYYLPRFKKMSDGESPAKWNWASFFFTPYWLLFRKNYLVGGLLLLFEILQSIIITYIETIKLNFIVDASSNMPGIYDQFQSIMNSGGPLAKYVYIIAIFGFISIAIRIVFGFFGNYIYMNTCVNKIKKQKELYPDCYKSKLHAIGGISFSLACLSYFICYFIPTIVELILK